MKNRSVQVFTLGATLASGLWAQTARQATIVRGNEPDRGRCTVEVVVDGVAQVEVHGGSGTLRTVAGQPAQWRRFECTSPMPQNPVNLRFEGVDGRGRQQLMREPRDGGNAVVQIEDKDGGSEGYTFNLFWETRGPGDHGNPVIPGPPADRRDQDARRDPEPRRDPDQDRYRPGYRESDYYRQYGHGFTEEEAVRVCQQSVLAEASRRFRTEAIHFHRTSAEDNPGRRDWVAGTLDIHRGPREERYGFSCSMDFSTGRVRSSQLDQRPLADDPRWHQ